MTQDQPNRLDRIEATLDRVAQQLDNQVVVNAELRQSVSELTGRVNDLTRTSEALLQIVTIHQQNFEQLAERERRREEFERTTSVALDRISTVLDYLVRQRGNDGIEQQH